MNMVYICNMKSSGKYNTKRWEEGECTLHCWPKSSEIYDCSRPVSGILKASIRWWLQWRNIYPGRGNSVLFEIEKKESWKPIYIIYIRWARALSTFSSRQNQSSASLKLRNYLFTRKLAIHLAAYIWHLKINANSGFTARENFSEYRNYIDMKVVKL